MDFHLRLGFVQWTISRPNSFVSNRSGAGFASGRSRIYSFLALVAFFSIQSQVEAIPDTNATARSVLLEATVQASPPKITLFWETAQNSTGVQVSRKSKGENFFPVPIATLPGSATSYEDTDVQVGVGYEYKIWTNPSQEGYLYAGIEIPPVGGSRSYSPDCRQHQVGLARNGTEPIGKGSHGRWLGSRPRRCLPLGSGGRR